MSEKAVGEVRGVLAEGKPSWATGGSLAARVEPTGPSGVPACGDASAERGSSAPQQSRATQQPATPKTLSAVERELSGCDQEFEQLLMPLDQEKVRSGIFKRCVKCNVCLHYQTSMCSGCQTIFKTLCSRCKSHTPMFLSICTFCGEEIPRAAPALPQDHASKQRSTPKTLLQAAEELGGTHIGPTIPPGWHDPRETFLAEDMSCQPEQTAKGDRVRGWDHSLVAHYNLLGLPRGSGETAVRKKYLELLARYHPASGGEQDEYTALCEAYDAISHDAHLAEKELQGHPESKAAGTIFVSMVCYRDCEGRFTLKDMFQKAKHPGRIFAGIVWQHALEDDPDVFEGEVRYHSLQDIPQEFHKHTRQVHINFRDAEGPLYARHLAQRLWNGEEYFLQIDSHMRFMCGWDEKLLRFLKECPSRKPILTTYPLGYVLKDVEQRKQAMEEMAEALEKETERVRADRGDPTLIPLHEKAFEVTRRFRWSAPDVDVELPEDMAPAVICATKFHARTGLCSFAPKQLKEAPQAPVPSLFWSGSFSFGRAEMMKECPYDPHMPFLMMGEEFLTGARLFTHGWDFFVPPESVVFHLYDRSYRQLSHM